MYDSEYRSGDGDNVIEEQDCGVVASVDEDYNDPLPSCIYKNETMIFL